MYVRDLSPFPFFSDLSPTASSREISDFDDSSDGSIAHLLENPALFAENISLLDNEDCETTTTEITKIINQITEQLQDNPERIPPFISQIIECLNINHFLYLLGNNPFTFKKIVQNLEVVQKVAFLQEIVESTENWQNFVESIASDAALSQEAKMSFATTIVENQFDEIRQNWGELTKPSKQCLLQAMFPSQQKILLRQHRQDISDIAFCSNILFTNLADYRTRLALVTFICTLVPTNRLSAYICELNTLESQMGPYLLKAFSDEQFEEFLFSLLPRDRSKFLSYPIVEGDSKELMAALLANEYRRQYISTIISFDMENDIIPVGDPLTLYNCLEHLSDINGYSAEHLALHSPFIAQIPPFLVSFLSSVPENIPRLMNVIPYLTEKQIQFFFLPIPNPISLLSAVHEKSPLSMSRFIAILEIVETGPRLEDFLARKLAPFKENHLLFFVRWQLFQKKLSIIKQNQEPSKADLINLEADSNKLHALVRTYLNEDFRSFHCFLQTRKNNTPTMETILKEFTDLSSSFKEKHRLFTGKHAIVPLQLEEIEKKINAVHGEEEETDLTTILYEGFWTMLRDGVLPSIGISPHSSTGIAHPGELNLVGVTSNEDLHLLGVSPQFDAKIQLCERLLFEIAKNEVARISFFKCWQIFVNVQSDIKVEPNTLVSSLEIDRTKLDLVKANCAALYKELRGFIHLSGKDHEDLRKAIKSLQNPADATIKVEVRSLQLSLEKIIPLLQNQYPLYILKRYLTGNPGIKKAWEVLREAGLPSISSLIKQGHIKTADDFLRLSAIAAAQSKS